MTDQKLEIVIAARDLASGVLKGVAGNLTRDIKGVEASSVGLSRAGTQMAASTVTGFGKMKVSAASYRGELGLTSIAMAGIAGAAAYGLKGAVDAAMNDEKVQTRLAAAIHATGHAISSAKLIKLAEDLAEITPFAKADTEGMEALLAGMGFTEDQIIKMTPTFQDLTVVMKKNGDEGATLESTDRMLGASFLKNTPPMARTGVVIDKLTWSAMGFDDKLKLLHTHGEGAAEALGKTAAGQMEVFGHQMEDLKVTVGTGLIPVLKDLVAVGKPLVGMLKSVAESKIGPPLIIGTTAALGLAAIFNILGPIIHSVRAAIAGHTAALSADTLAARANTIANLASGESMVTQGGGAAVGLGGKALGLAKTAGRYILPAALVYGALREQYNVIKSGPMIGGRRPAVAGQAGPLPASAVASAQPGPGGGYGGGGMQYAPITSGWAEQGWQQLPSGAWENTNPPAIPRAGKPTVRNTAPNVDVSGDGNKLLIEVQIPQPDQGTLDDATTAYLDDTYYAGDD